MSALRYGVAAAAVCAGIVVPTSAQQVITPVAMPSQQPAMTRPVVVAEQGQHGSWDRMGMRGFSVALVVGDLTGAATADNLPAGAKKALSDMRDFLPYKSYRLLDTHWILCCSHSSQAGVSGRLRGAEEEEYSFSIHVRAVNDFSELGITFSLRESGGGSSTSVDQAFHSASSTLSSNDRSRMMAELMRERVDLQARSEEAANKYGERHPSRAKLQAELENNARRIRDLEQGAATRTASRGTRPVLDSTFSMKVGETVVIGTSRLKGDKALIALLTAASRNSTAPREP